MTKKIGVAEAKKGFSEIISRIVYKGERFVLERKGKPMAAIVSIKDLERLEEVHGEEIKKGLLAAIGAWQDFENLDDIISEIYKARKKAKDRKISAL